ncbi:MAG: cell wall metabolism sensor histidine kinase WalK [Alicyclobacillus sp.]|nr:cell wall metabolism sensor histidine kinase WalK [Alicyclobacillus sp.]
MVVFVLTVLSILLQQFFDNYVYQQQARELTRIAGVMQTLVITRGPEFAQSVAEELQVVQNAEIDVGVPLVAHPELGQTYRTFSPAIRLQLERGLPVPVRSKSDDSDTISVYQLVKRSGQPGLIVVRQRMSVLADVISRMRNIILFATAIGVILFTGLAFVISKNLSRPLIQMHKVAEEMAHGDFNGRINVVTNDEVGRLGRTFNALAGQLKRTIAALSMEKEQLSKILSSLEDGVVATDLEGRITLANPPALRRLSTALLAETGEPGEGRLPPSMQKLLATVVQLNEPIVRETMWQGRHMVITMRPLYESNGSKIRSVVAVLRDVTEERRLDRLRKDFLANVSHELRTPLSMMQGYTEALLDEFGDDPVQRRELTEIIHDETMRMKRLVNDLLDLAQLESGQFQLSLRELDIVGLARRVGRKFQTLAAERDVALVTELPDQPIVVWGDADRLEQVLTNLLDNALRHTSSGGRVSAEVGVRRSHATIRVSDTGSGIPEEDLPYIWERFYKADKARTRGTSGTGLGLAISRQIVLEHGGDIIVESAVGQGTTFTVVIPLASATAPAEQSKRAT